MSPATLDPITLAVIRSGLMYAVAEMKAVVVRTAYSNLWKEAGDLSCGLLTSHGDLAVQGVGDIPIHLASMPMTLRACMKKYPPEKLYPGDVLFQNDPYQGNNHLPDLLMAKPVFFNGKIIAYTAVRGHYVDIGGGGPGSYSAAMPDIYAEGLRIPPVKIFERGELNEDIVGILVSNTRNSRERLGDLRAQYAGCLAAERRVLAFCEKYGEAQVSAALAEIINAGEVLTRNAIKEIPDGEYAFEDFCDGDGIEQTPFKIAVKVTVRGSDIEVDFAGSSPQVRGGMNSPIAVTTSAACYAIKCLTDYENPPNSGSYRPIKISAPLGSVVNPRPPAPVVAANHETASRIADAIIGALAPVLPDRVCAAGTGSSGVLSLGARVASEDGEREILLVEAHGAGQGGNKLRDGYNARRVSVGNTGNTPNEALEANFPIHIIRYGISEDCAGAGRARGGTGITRELRFDHETTLTLTCERAVVPPYGLFGGASARTAEFWLIYPDGRQEVLPSKTAPIRVPKGTILHFRPAGGGGFGPAEQRSIEAIQDDVDDGYVRPESARELYGVLLANDPKRVEGPWVVTGRR